MDQGAKSMKKTQQVSEVVMQKLQQEIRCGMFAGHTFLPPEVELAERLNVSRNIVRESLTCLEREGWVTRKHGVGTLINKSVVRVKNRLDQTCGLKQALELNGKQVDVEILNISPSCQLERIATKLELEADAPILQVEHLFYADGKPAIYCSDYIPERAILKKDYSKEDFHPTIFDFFEKFCGTTVETYLTEVKVQAAPARVAEVMKVAEGYRMFYLGELGYDLRSNPLFYAEEYYVDDAIQHMIVRKMM